MTESEWNACVDLNPMLLMFANDPKRKDLILFGCACCRRVWDHIADERLRRGVEIRERFEQGLALGTELEEAEQNARLARRDVRAACDPLDVDEHALGSAPAWAAGSASNAAYGNYRAASDLAACAAACAASGDWKKDYDKERAAQCELLRSMVANPNRS